MAEEIKSAGIAATDREAAEKEPDKIKEEIFSPRVFVAGLSQTGREEYKEF